MEKVQSVMNTNWPEAMKMLQNERPAYNTKEYWERAAKIMMYANNEMEQMIARLYPDEFPSYPEDWNTSDLCVGEHVPESLLDKLINEVLELRAK